MAASVARAGFMKVMAIIDLAEVSGVF